MARSGDTPPLGGGNRLALVRWLLHCRLLYPRGKRGTAAAEKVPGGSKRPAR